MPLTLLAGDGSMSKTTMETLFDDKAQRTVIRRRTAMDRSLPSIRVSPTLVEVPGFEDEVCDRLYFIDAFKAKSKKSDVPISAWGVTAVAKDSPGAPEPELLRIRFGRPTKQAKRAFAQPPGTIELLMGQDYARWFPKVGRDSTERKDDLYFLRAGLSPRGIVYGEAAVELVVERRKSGKRSGRESRESSGASACREPDGNEQGQGGQTVEENMFDLFGTVSTSEESSCSDKPYDPTHGRKKWKKAAKKKRERSPSRSKDRNETMSEAEQQGQQPQPSTSKMTTLEAMAAKKEELDRMVMEHVKLMELEQEWILKQQEEDKRRQQAADRKKKRAE
jgi:hypothetical protein